MTVHRSQDLSLDELLELHPAPSHIVISPGPGHPLNDSGISIPVIRHFAGKVPILGVCMGLQCIYASYGGSVDGAGEIIHGKTSGVSHDGKGLFKNLAQNIQSTRYHSLAGNLSSLPKELEVTSRTQADSTLGEKGGIVMGIRHKTYVMEAVQYHPESILSEEGKILLGNFLAFKGGLWSDNPAFAVAGSAASTNLSPPKSTSVPTILNSIYAQRTKDVVTSKNTPGARSSDLETLLALHVAPPIVSLVDRLRSHSMSPSSMQGSVALMAEYKRASPSKGDIMSPDSPVSAASIALSYALAGAAVISVLTEPKHFKGSLTDMRCVRDAIHTLPNRPAVLRKDFVLDAYQIDEARIYGADTVLLIVAMLDDDRLQALYDHSVMRGMEPLVEVNSADELERALNIGARVIGVNNRNLHDFKVDMSTTTRIADVIKARRGEEGAKDVILCALSGISSHADVARYMAQGVGAVLVGEALMRAKDKGVFVRELLGTTQEGNPGSQPEIVKLSPPDALSSEALDQASLSSPASSPLVKICGIKTVEAALAACEAGADLIGLVFARESKRYVEPTQAHAIISAVRNRSRSAASQPSASSSSPPLSDWFSFQSAMLKRREKPLFVGVFQNAALEDLRCIADDLRLDAVQLHGSEPAEWSTFLSVPVIKAFHVDQVPLGQLDVSITSASRPGYHALPLLDTKVGSGKDVLSGGAGIAFDWSIARRVSEDQCKFGLPRLPIILAGGLTPDNVRSAVDQVEPWAVDVSGGVETEGEKNLEKIRRFIKMAKGGL